MHFRFRQNKKNKKMVKAELNDSTGGYNGLWMF